MCHSVARQTTLLTFVIVAITLLGACSRLPLNAPGEVAYAAPPSAPTTPNLPSAEGCAATATCDEVNAKAAVESARAAWEGVRVAQEGTHYASLGAWISGASIAIAAAALIIAV